MRRTTSGGSDDQPADGMVDGRLCVCVCVRVCASVCGVLGLILFLSCGERKKMTGRVGERGL